MRRRAPEGWDFLTKDSRMPPPPPPGGTLGTGEAGAHSRQVFPLPSTCLKEFRKGACTRRRGITRDNRRLIAWQRKPCGRAAALPVLCESPPALWSLRPAPPLRPESPSRLGLPPRLASLRGPPTMKLFLFLFLLTCPFITGDSQPRYFLIVIKIRYLLSFYIPLYY